MAQGAVEGLDADLDEDAGRVLVLSRLMRRGTWRSFDSTAWRAPGGANENSAWVARLEAMVSA